MTHPLVGQPVPEFSLPDQDGVRVSSTDLSGSDTLIVFVPFAFSPVCTYELEQLRDASDLTSAGARVVIVNCDSTYVNQEWAYQNKFEGTLLSDFWPHGAMCERFGVFDAELGRAKRGSFHVDANGIVDWVLVSPTGDARDLAEYRKVLGVPA
ncbi:MAG: redoxin domain-containing protein [Demequinaceae bacterium]|nr:redoxin domain-containing protein [Demequinaceae bacterium]